MKEKIIIPIFVVISIIFGVMTKLAYDRFSYHQLRDNLNPNFVELINNTTLDTQLFKITWTTHYSSKELILFKEKKYLNPKFKEYGKNFFHVWYMDSLMASFGQFKHNNWHGHTYTEPH